MQRVLNSYSRRFVDVVSMTCSYKSASKLSTSIQYPVLRQEFIPRRANTFPPFHAKSNVVPDVKVSSGKHSEREWSLEEAQDALHKHSVFSWGASEALFQSAIHIDRGEGVYLIDKSGKRYLDWSAGAVCTNMGHTVPKTVQGAIEEQLHKTPFVYGDLATHDYRARLCALLAEISPADINGIFFASSGTEANECAIRAAKRFTGRPKILSRYRSYHGSSSSALAMTGDFRTWAVDASMTGFVKMMDPFPFHFSWDDDAERASQKCLQALHDQILFEGPNSIAAIFLEPITGGNGWLKPPDSFMQGVRALCDEYGMLMIVDEVMTGFGRTGEMFGFQHYPGVVPDMYTFAKGVTSSYLPLSGVAMRDPVFDHFRHHPLGYGSTYFAHPVCCAAAYETVKYLIENDVVHHVKKMETVMKEELGRLVQQQPAVKQARVVGLGGGFDLAGEDGDFLMNMHETHPKQLKLKQRLLDEGLVTLMRGHHVHCTPPLVIEEHELREGFRMLNKALSGLL